MEQYNKKLDGFVKQFFSLDLSRDCGESSASFKPILNKDENEASRVIPRLSFKRL